jgi:hypothetical protein
MQLWNVSLILNLDFKIEFDSFNLLPVPSIKFSWVEFKQINLITVT